MCGRFSYFIFAYALVRAGGMPFPVRLDTPSPAMTREQMLADTDGILTIMHRTMRKCPNNLLIARSRPTSFARHISLLDQGLPRAEVILPIGWLDILHARAALPMELVGVVIEHVV